MAALVCATLVGGCYVGADGGGLTSERGLAPNGVTLNGLKFNGLKFNGVKFNGVKFNGLKLNGLKLNGVKLNGLKLNGLKLNGLKLNGSEFTAAYEVDGVVVGGPDVVGMTFDLTIDVEVDGEMVPADFELRVDDMYPDPEALTDDVFLYDLSMRAVGSDEWINPCVDEEGQGVGALPLQNYWDLETGDRIDDPNVISWSCTTGVLTHCVEWGYRPWETSLECDGEPPKGPKWKVEKWKEHHCDEVSLADHHQACTRMARADYCGDGTAWTVAGTAIDIWDGLDPEIQVRELDWKIEAEWTPDGAYCLSDIRQQEWKAEGMYPSCGKAFDKHNKKIKDCGSLDDNRALLVSSFEPPKKDKGKKKKSKKKWWK